MTLTLGLLTAALGVTGLVIVPATAATAAPQHVGVAPRVPAGAVRVADPDANAVLHLDVALSPRDPAALAAFVNSVSTPGNANYHHYLAKGQFASVFGPTKASVDALRTQLTAEGLTVGTPSSDALTLPVTTTVSGAEHAFGVGIAGYKLANGRTAYANTAAPSLPAAVAHTVSGVLGLDNLTPLPTPQHTGTKDQKAAPKTSVAPHANAKVRSNGVKPQSVAPTTCAPVQNLFPNLTDGKDYWEPSSLSSGAAYNTGNLYWSYGNTGSGVTVGLFELEDFSDIDIASYQDCYGTSVPVTRVLVDGGPTAAPDPLQNIGIESALDIEAVAGVAPGSSIRVYQGPDATNPNTTLGEVLDTYTAMVNDDAAQVLSTSWGACELDSDTTFMNAESNVFAQAAAQGQTVVAAAGDFGSTECAPDQTSTGAPSPNAGLLSVSDPASQPYVTGVGGTAMQLNGNGGVNLTTWNEQQNTNLGIPAGATGGGVSHQFSLSGASNYQSGVQGPGYSNACGAATGVACRQSPDVSAIGALSTGWLIANGQDGQGGEYWGVIGGTSLSAPLWGAITALADASNSCAANGSVGFANPALYANPAALTDVTTGNNILQGQTVSQYSAGSGYDLTTGLGSPRAPQLVEALCGGTAATAGSSFVPAGPTRLLDTRNTGGPIGANSARSLQVTGANGVPATGVTAVVLNITATDTSSGSFLTVYPDGTARPLASNVNFDPGETIPNLVTVPVGSDGAVDIYNLNGSVDVVADLFGYYTTGTGSLYQPVTPIRVLDTRSGTGPIGVPSAAPIGQDQSISVQLSGANGVPATGVTGVVLNVTATDSSTGSYLTVYPDGITRPLSSNLNFSAGQTIPNLVTVPVGSDGKVDIYNFSGTTDVVADLFGYYTSSGTGFKFHPSAPHRMVDTRIGNGVTPGQPAPVGSGQTFAMPIADTNGAGNAGPFTNAAALVLNVTVTGPTAGGYVTVYPSGVIRPLSSNLNFNAGQTIPNAVLTPVNGNSIDFYNFAGNTSLVVDVDGYFAKS
ncbi:MAG TPA: S53 family peptidase [Pseudonocardiaceae bacterium]|nr:S53 family peptidase [Pseudonocardiaceae bacterium]